MTVKIFEKKINNLERRLSLVERMLRKPKRRALRSKILKQASTDQRHKILPQTAGALKNLGNKNVWDATYGVMSKATAKKLLHSVESLRAAPDRSTKNRPARKV